MTLPQWMSMADPIHGMIRLKRHSESHQLILEVMNSHAFQRLRRIKQMGMAEFVFPGATHTRFVHSIGSTWLMIKTIEHLMEFEETRLLLESKFEDTGISIDKLLLIGILTHDIGHTPLSHTLEDILSLKERGFKHDTYWNQLILGNDEELRKIWNKYDKALPETLFRFNGWTDNTKPHFLADLISSQLDMDRLDYLLRDSHYLGVQYGRVEAERIITNLSIGITPEGEKAVAIREEAVPAVEHYLFGRYEAYKMALHSLDKASEILLKKTLERFCWVREQGLDPGHPADLLYKLIVNAQALHVDEYLMLDDCYLWDKVNIWARFSNDSLLRYLANRLLGHDLFKYVEVLYPEENLPDETWMHIKEEMITYYARRNLSFQFGFDRMTLAPRPLYQSYPLKPPLWIKRKKGELVDFAYVSALTLEHKDLKQDRRHLFFVWDKAAKQHLNKTLEKYFYLS